MSRRDDEKSASEASAIPAEASDVETLPNHEDEHVDVISSLLDKASMGSVEAARSFYHCFDETCWFVPSRPASGIISNESQYPSEVYGYLAIETNEHSIVPIFSSEIFLQEWAGREIAFRKISGRQLRLSLPDDWWIGINPNQSVEKELSPWELKHIGLGPEGIDEALAELFDYSPAVEATTCELDLDAHSNLVEALIEAGQEKSQVQAIFALEKRGLTFEDQEISELLIGIAVNPDAYKSLEELQDFFSRTVDLHLIGSIKGKVYMGIWGTQSIALNIFSQTTPIFQRAEEVDTND